MTIPMKDMNRSLLFEEIPIIAALRLALDPDVSGPICEFADAETLTYLKLSYSDLALRRFIPEMVLRDAVNGNMGLSLGQWIRLGKVRGLPTMCKIRPSERDGAPRWEVCFPPVHVPLYTL
jgi:hypothetical protein